MAAICTLLRVITDAAGITFPAHPKPEGLPTEYLLGENGQMLTFYANGTGFKTGPQSHTGVRVAAILGGRHMNRLLAELVQEFRQANGRAFVLGDYPKFLDTVGNMGFIAWIQESNWLNPANHLPETDYNVGRVYRLGILSGLSLDECQLLAARVFGRVPSAIKAAA